MSLKNAYSMSNSYTIIFWCWQFCFTVIKMLGCIWYYAFSAAKSCWTPFFSLERTNGVRWSMYLWQYSTYTTSRSISLDDTLAREIRIIEDSQSSQASLNTLEGLPFFLLPFPWYIFLCNAFIGTPFWQKLEQTFGKS